MSKNNTSKQGRGPEPSNITKNMLFAVSAGRCQFEGCNKPLSIDDLTRKKYNKSHIAHIVASNPMGARGDLIRSHKLSDKLSNLMLMCPEHHKLIDDFEDEYSEYRLLQMKEKHERAIHEQCSLIFKEASEIIMISSPIKGRIPVKISYDTCAEAVMPDKRVSSEYGQRINIDISSDYRSPEYWAQASKILLNQYSLKVGAILDEKQNAHFSVFPLAPIPLIIAVGSLLGDKIRSNVFQFSRTTNSWAWESDTQTNDFNLSKLKFSEGSRVALVLSLTADISPERIKDVFDADIIFFIKANRFGVDCIKSPQDLNAFWKSYQTTCDEIKNSYSQAKEICVFPAIPVSAAFEVGRRHMPGVYPALKIFDDDNGFFETITIGG